MKTIACLRYVVVLFGIHRSVSVLSSSSETFLSSATTFGSDKQNQNSVSETFKANTEYCQDCNPVTSTNNSLLAGRTQGHTSNANLDYSSKQSQSTTKSILEFAFTTVQGKNSTCNFLHSTNFMNGDLTSELTTTDPKVNFEEKGSSESQNKHHTSTPTDTTSVMTTHEIEEKGSSESQNKHHTSAPTDTTSVMTTHEIKEKGSSESQNKHHTSTPRDTNSVMTTPEVQTTIISRDEEQKRNEIAIFPNDVTPSTNEHPPEDDSIFGDRTTEKYGGITGADSDHGSEEDYVSLQLNVTAQYCGESICDGNKSHADNCYCDDLCYFYNDCCLFMIDELAKEVNNKSGSLNELIKTKSDEVRNKTIMLTREMISCIGDDNNTWAFIMVTRCNKTLSSIPLDYIDHCEQSGDAYDVSNVPVDYVVNGKVLATFKNIYCAFCNGFSQNELEFWHVNISCYSKDTETIASMELEELAMNENCVLRQYSMIEVGVRRCLRSSPVEICHTETDNETENLCKSYYYPVTPEYNKSTVYRNPHCAACANGNRNVSNLTCFKIVDKMFKPEGILTPVNLQLVFDFSFESGIIAKVKCGLEVTCKPYEVYDCITKRCTQLYCPAGKTPLNGECIDSPGNFLNLVTESLKPIDLSVNETEVGNTSTYIVELIDNNDLKLVVYALGTSIHRVLDIMYEALNRNGPQVSVTGKLDGCFCMIIESINADIVKEIFPNLVGFFDKLERRENLGYSLIPPYVTIRNFRKLTLLECEIGDLFTYMNPLIVESNLSVSFLLASSGFIVPGQNCRWEVGYNKTAGLYSNVIATCLVSILDHPNLNCSMVAYNLDEVIISNNSVKVINTTFTVFKEDGFAIFQNKVFICSDAVTDLEYFVDFFLYTGNHRVLSIVTSSASALSAVVIIIVHCMSKRLRNIHGLNLTALSVSIFLLHLLLLVQTFATTDTLCISYAIFLHLILLNNFVWMNIIGFDMTRIFLRDKILSQSSPVKRFLGYVCISILIPVLITGVAVVLNFTDSQLKPSYGDKNVCWLSNGRSILAFVIGPVMFSLTLNCCFFIFTVIAITKKVSQTKLARSSVNRSYFVVYLKLTMVLGLTWIVGLVAAFVKQEWTWVVHLILNGLQGLSLLVCSLVNARNVRQLQSSLRYTNTSSTGTRQNHVNGNM